MIDPKSAPSLLSTAAKYAAVVVLTAAVLLLVNQALDKDDPTSVSVTQILEHMVIESEDERLALQLILTGDLDKVARGRGILEESALEGRPTAQRHLATYWALTDTDQRRARVYQWLLVALACARGIDREAGTDTQINYLLFLTNIALIEHSTSDSDKALGKSWAQSWFGANIHAPGLQLCDVSAIDEYSGG